MKSDARKFGIVAGLLLGSAAMLSAADVTFQVNMEVQTATGTFNPSAHTMEVHGSFNGWGAGVALVASPTNANIYKGTISASTGTQILYKFVINQSGPLVWENDGVGPNGTQNRAFTVPANDVTIPDVYFNNQSTPPGVVAVTFQINMGVQRELGNFDPATQLVLARGSFDNWGSGINLSQSASDPDVYQGVANITGAGGTTIEHKFVMDQAGTLVWEGNVGPGGPFGNRTFTLSATSPQTLPVVYFNNVTNNPGTGIPVTFQANMAVQIARGVLDPATGRVDVRGPFNNWGTPSGLVLTNSPDNPWIFVGSLNIANAAPGAPIPHKFTLNGNWEAGGDRTFVLADSAQTLPPRYFDDVSNLGPVSLRMQVIFDVEIIVSWTAGPRVRLQQRSDLTNGQWEDVPDTAGQGEKSFILPPFVDAGNMFYRLVGP